ncbi:MAG: putative toxin-antitoxin system toxin component, PIN family [Bacteroidota bacterium]
MAEWQRFVFDTSTVIGAALSPEGKPRAALVQAALHGELCASVAAYSELTSRLSRPKFDRYLDDAERTAFLDWFEGLLSFVPVTTSVTDCRDLDDNKFLALALDSAADVLVSSDADLLVLHPYRGIAVLSPTDFLRELAE